MIKLEQYKIFNEAASTLSFSKAAKNLFISQSAVSQTIHALEKELNTQLFIRLNKGVTLTKEGMLLHKNITEALALITSVENELSHYNELLSGQLNIGAGDSICENYLIDLLKQFHHIYHILFLDSEYNFHYHPNQLFPTKVIAHNISLILHS